MPSNEFTVGSLFSGIGGFDLGLERAGMRIVWQCESDKFCQRVLAKHWPEVPCYEDVCELTAAHVEPVDALVGGFPCQGLSDAGKRLGLLDPRSGLWTEYARLIRELQPRYVIVENVAALLARGMGRVLGDLAALGYDAEWDCIPACAVGAPHRRDRVWLVAYPNSQRVHGPGQCRPGRGQSQNGRLEDPTGSRREPSRSVRSQTPRSARPLSQPARSDWWAAEPDVGRVAHGVPDRVHRLRSLGNALVPQIAEWIGQRILSWEAESVM